MRPSLILLLSLLLTSMAAQSAEVTHLNSSGNMAEGLPFSEAVRVDDTLYLSGQIGNLPGTLTLAEGGMAGEAQQVLANIRGVLEANGLGMANVVKCLVMLRDMSEWSDFNAIYVKAFEPPYPARSAMGAAGLALGARVEVECMAVYPDE